MSNFSFQYMGLLRTLLMAPVQTNARTGVQVRVVRGGVWMAIDLSDNRLPVPGCRRVHPKTAAAEVAWFLMATRDVTWLRKHAPIWDKFVEDDGVSIEAAYGYRWSKHFGRDQLALAVSALRKDHTDRRIVVSTWDPGLDGLGAPHQKNVPCPASFTLSLLDGELHSTMLVRSSDVFVGLPYDVMGHALLVSAIAKTLNRRAGVVTVGLAHAHLYEPHWAMAERCLQEPLRPLGPPIPHWDLDEIKGNPDTYVLETLRLGLLAPQPSYDPKPEVVV